MKETVLIASTGGFSKTTYLEAMKGSGTANKVLFLSNVEFLSLIGADDKIEAFKKIIDEQMKKQLAVQLPNQTGWAANLHTLSIIAVRLFLLI